MAPLNELLQIPARFVYTFPASCLNRYFIFWNALKSTKCISRSERCPLLISHETVPVFATLLLCQRMESTSTSIISKRNFQLHN